MKEGLNKMNPEDTNNTRLIGAMRRLARRRKPSVAHAHRDRSGTAPPGGRDWQQLIETELDALNRRLTSIEARMTIIFYLIVILTISTLVTNADAAQTLLRGVLQLK